ncbi:MAG: tyrosine-type recombinase/integrase [Pseudomonadota bacterium]|nr:tyrosine-type recombinase/integrase [Pseudomonadota bacterium]
MQSGLSGLPRYVRFKSGRYYFEPKGNLKKLVDGKSSVPLGADFNEMLQQYSEIMGLDPLEARLGNITMTELARWHLDEIEKRCTKDHATRQKHKAKLVEKFFGDSLVRDIRRMHIEEYKRHRLEDSARVFNNDFAFIQGAFKLAMRWEIIDRNPCEGVEKLKKIKRVVPLADDELLEMFNFMAARRPLVCMYMYVKLLCGRRAGELVNLTEDCITERGVVFTLSKKKGKPKALVCWTPKFREAFESMLQLLEQEGFYKPSKSDSSRVKRKVRLFGKLTVGAMGKRFERLRTEAIEKGVIETSFHGHDLRSIGARKLTLEDAKDFLRHSNIETTRFYYHEEENYLPEIKPLL